MCSDRKTDLRIFLGLGDTCGYYSQLERGLIKLGVDTLLVDAFPNRTYQRFRSNSGLPALVERLGRIREDAPRGSFRRLLWKFLQAVGLAILFPFVALRYDIFVFSGGTSFFRSFDLPLLRMFGKRIIVVHHGSDSRPPYLNGAFVGCEGDVDWEGCLRETRAIKKRQQWIERYASVIVDHPMNSHFHERQIVQWLCIGIPYDLASLDTPTSEPATRRPGVSVLHAPTRPGPKGTARIESAIDSLRAAGQAIDYVRIEGRPNREVLQAIASCDFVVDELFSDTTMASFATEAALFRRPAIVGMYGLDVLQSITPPAMLPPGYVCHPDRVEEAIDHLVRDGDLRTSLGRKARAFVEGQWSSESVAERVLKLASGEFPDEWLFNPSEIQYLHGWGLTEQRLRTVLRGLIARAGVASLCLGDKPEVEETFARFAGVRTEYSAGQSSLVGNMYIS